MTDPNPRPGALFEAYAGRLQSVIGGLDYAPLEVLAETLLNAWRERRQVFICGNGGSAGNAVHIANDLLYGISKTFGSGLRVTALPANGSVVTCLANDEGYDAIFSYQLGVLAEARDVLIVMSGSGNSPNILRALETARERKMTSFGILGFSGGKALAACDHAIHCKVDDMQISEDMQLVVLHMVMQWLYSLRTGVVAKAAE
jgi:D-sedoheptulose 7-phosphate isomerase